MRLLFILFTFIFLFGYSNTYSQGTCATATNLGTPTSTQSCQTITSGTGTTGGTSCTGGGWGGNSFSIRYVTFCTDASNSCVNLDFNSLGGWAGNINFTLYQGSASCGTGVAVGAVQQCQSGLTAGGSVSFSPTNNSGVVVTTANTCYTLRMAFETAPSAANPIQLCVYTEAPAANDVCSGAMPIDGTPQPTNNDPSCLYSGGPTTNSPTLTPGSFCAGSLENTSWYSFTVQNTGDVVITIGNITCVGGGSGFQIGYFTGNCGSLTNIGCNSGSGGTVTTTITGLTAGQVVTIGIDGNAGAFCNFDISATNTVPLPIELLSFNANYNEDSKNVVLDWTTISEINNDFFTIEKSIDGENFEVVGIVDGSGNSNSYRTYNTLDEKPYVGTSYYRLKQTDFDGQFEYSDLVPVKVEDVISNPTIYPNPITNNGVLEFSTNSTEATVVTVYDVSGRIVLSNQHLTNKGINKIQLETNELTNGMYFISLKNGNSKTNLKFIKE